MNVEKRIEELTSILEEANYNYYVLDNPTITDQEFDKYLRELTELEMEYPDLKKDMLAISVNRFRLIKELYGHDFDKSESVYGYGEHIRKQIQTYQRTLRT